MTSDADPNPLITLLRECVVRIDDAEGFSGTGFFVSPGRVVTCAHVIRGARNLSVTWQGRPPVSATSAKASPPLESVTGGGLYPLPDLAVIDLGAEAEAWGHPCVCLSAGPPVLGTTGSGLYLEGYTEEFKADFPALTGASTEFEAEVREGGHVLFKFKRGQVRPGYSGSPLLDRRAGAVVGIVDASRNVDTDLGGFAVPVAELIAAFADMAAANREFHRGDRRWEVALEAERVRADERAGNRGRLGLHSAVLRPPKPQADTQISAAALFSPRYALVEYVGRDQLLEDLAAWRERDAVDGGPVELRFVTAGGGFGKTRLAVEACAEAEGLGWTAGLVPIDVSEADIRSLAEWPGRLLLVIDHVEARPRLVARLVAQFAARAPRPPVRILLLVRRPASWKQLLNTLNEERDEELAALLRHAPVLLEEADAEIDRLELFRRACVGLAPWSGSGTGVDASVQPLPSLRAPHFARPLYVLVAAYLHLRRQPAGAGALSEAGLLRLMLEDFEVLYWEHTADRRNLQLEPEDRWNAVAVATLMTAEGNEEALAVARLVPFIGPESELKLIAVARWLAELYPSAAADGELRIDPLEPDRLGEALVADVLGRYPDLLPAAFDAASERQLVHALTVVTHAAADYPVVKGQLSRALDQRLPDFYRRGLAVGNHALFNAVVVAMIVSRPIEGAIAVEQMLFLALPRWLQDHVIGVAGLAVEGLREHVSQEPAREPELVTALNRMSARLSMMGRWDEAADCAREAVSRSRELDRDQPGAFTTLLAVSLLALVSALVKVGRSAESETPADETVALCRTLVAADPAEGRPHLAASLRNLANVLSGGPRQADGLTAAQEAVSIDRELSAADGWNYDPGLAESLTALAVAHYQSGQPTLAADTADEAVALFRSLAKAHGGAYLPELAQSLGILAAARHLTGQPEQALLAASEAVATYRRLTEGEDSPGGYRAALAGSLGTLAIALDETADLEGALDAWQEAVDICRWLTAANSHLYRPDLASALAGLAAAWWRAGELESALEASNEAVSIHRSVAEDGQATYRLERARALTHLAVYLADADLTERALSIGREAVDEYRQLAVASAAYRADLTAALTNLAGFLNEAGHLDEAVRTATEAVAMYEGLTEPVPSADVSMLAGSLQSLADLLLDAGSADEAVDRAQQAVDLYRTAAARSRGELPGVAASLRTLAECLASAGRVVESLQVAREAIGLYQELVGTVPAAHAGRLGEAVGFLAGLLESAGRRDEAADLFTEILTRFAEDPDALGPVLLARGHWHLSHGDLGEAIDDLDGAMRAAENAGDRSTRGKARWHLRHLREQDGVSFDQAWGDRQRAPLPVWLRYLTDDDRLIGTVGSWAKITFLSGSRAYLEENADALLSDEAEAALEHFIDVNPGTGFLESRLSLVRAARADGIDSAYEDLTRQVLEREAEETLSAWLSGGDPHASRDFAYAHASDLVRPVTVMNFDRACAEHPEILSFRLHRGILHFAAQAQDPEAGFRAAYELVVDAAGLRAALTASDPSPSGRMRLAFARMYSGQFGDNPEAHFLLATVLLSGEEPGEEEFGSPGGPVSLEHLAEASAVLADCAENSVLFERRDFAVRLAEFLAGRPELEPRAAELMNILTAEPPAGGRDPD